MFHQPEGHDCRHRRRRGILTELAEVAFLAQDLAGPAERRVRRLGQVELQLEVVHLREARAQSGSALRATARGAALQPSLDIRAGALGQLVSEHIAQPSVVGHARCLPAQCRG
jgi:hypothetical protein